MLLSAGPLEVLSLWDFELWGKFLLSEPQASSEIFSTLLAKSHRLSTSYGSEACSANEPLHSRLPSLPGVRLRFQSFIPELKYIKKKIFPELYPSLAQFRTPNVKVLI